MLRLVTGIILAGAAVNEGMAARRLWLSRRDQYIAAKARAAELGRPLIVVGDPYSGAVTRLFPAAGCGDLCVDLTGCPACPIGQAMDVTQGLPNIGSGTAVVFISCVLEYTRDPAAVMTEAMRIAGDLANLFVVAVDPNTATSYLYPGAKFQLRDGRWTSVETSAKIAVGTALAATAAAFVVSWKVDRDEVAKK